MEYLCIKTGKMSNGKNKGRWTFTKGKKYMVTSVVKGGIEIIDNMGEYHEVTDRCLSNHFVVIED